MSSGHVNNYYPAFSSDKVFKDHEARSYVERYFPNALNYENQNQNQNQYANQNPQYPNQYQQQQPPNQYQQQQQPQDLSNYYNQRPPYNGGQVKKKHFISHDFIS